MNLHWHAETFNTNILSLTYFGLLLVRPTLNIKTELLSCSKVFEETSSPSFHACGSMKKQPGAHKGVIEISFKDSCRVDTIVFHFKQFCQILRRNIVQPPSRTDTCTIKWINKYLLFRPHISLEYNYISWCSEEDTSRIH